MTDNTPIAKTNNVQANKQCPSTPTHQIKRTPGNWVVGLWYDQVYAGILYLQHAIPENLYILIASNRKQWTRPKREREKRERERERDQGDRERGRARERESMI